MNELGRLSYRFGWLELDRRRAGSPREDIPSQRTTMQAVWDYRTLGPSVYIVS
jgi:hypothetical protein